MSAVFAFPLPNGKRDKQRPRRSKGCLTCRRRKVKCDEQRPICERCHKGFHPCEYGESFIFVNEPKTFTHEAQPPGKSSTLAISKTVTVNINSDHVPPSLDLHGFQNEIVISFLVKQLFVEVQSPPDDKHSISTLLLWNRDSTAYLSGLCLAEAFFSSIHRLSELKSHASVLYGQAVQRLKVELVAKANAQISPPRVTIWSALFLGVYEMISSDSMSNWLKHCHGVAAITHMIGPHGFEINEAKPIFQINRSFISIGAIADRKRTFLEQNAWKQIPWSLEPMSKTIAESLQDILCDVPGLMEDVDVLLNLQQCGMPVHQIASKLQSCFEELDVLRISWNYIHADSCWEVTSISISCTEVFEDRDPHFETMLVFSSLERAIEFVYFNTSYLLLHSMLRQLRSAKDPDALSLDLVSFPDDIGCGKYTLTFRSHDDRHENALAICRCVGYMINSNRGASGAFNLLFPLKVAYNHLAQFPNTQKWIADIMERISSTKGLFIGTQILSHY
ncbi:Ff.00g016070.m01.CDS01 [Fusarium sp. VM40]|nr:Ff.00g016070.m01.CDS01 [Fusarium sp. VM40]